MASNRIPHHIENAQNKNGYFTNTVPGCDPILNVTLLTGQHLRNIGCDLMPFRQKGEITGVPCTGTDEIHR